MAVLKTPRVMFAPASVAALGTGTGAEVDLSTALGMAITARITNGATPPTVACTATVEVRTDDAAAWRPWAVGIGGIVANGVYDLSWDLPPAIIRARVTFTGNTGQPVTCEALGHELTTV
jgi:hypothetical protein